MRLLTYVRQLAGSLIGLFLVLFTFTVAAGAAGTSGKVSLVWNANTEADLAGYKLLYGTTSGTYIYSQTVGTTPAAELAGLTPGTTYYCAVQAYNTSALSSSSSEEISFVVPKTPLPAMILEEVAGAVLTDGQTPLAFGNAAVLSGSITRNFTLRNTGTASLGNLAMSLDGTHLSDFAVVTDLPLAALSSKNGSFESSLDSWSQDGNVRSMANAASTEGASLVEFNYANTQPNGVLSQNFTTIPGTAYTLTFDVGVLAYNTNQQSLQTTVTGSETLLSKTLTLTGPGDGSTRWTSQSFVFVADSTTTTLKFADISTTTAAIDLRLDNVRVTPPASSASETAVTSLEPGASTTFAIAFSPSSLGTKTAALHISSNDPDVSTFDLAFTGNGVGQPEIAIRQSIGTELITDASAVSFTNSIPDSTSAPETIVIQNVGAADLSHLSLSIDGAGAEDFIVDSLKTDVLAPGEFTTVQVYFRPTSEGTKTAALHVFSEDADENPFTIKLVGNGTAAPEIVIHLGDGTRVNSNGSGVAFGNVNIGSGTTPQIFVIRNLGTANLTGLSVVLDGSSASDFLVDSLEHTALAPGSSTSIKVVLKPTAAGERTASLHIVSNDSDQNPFNIALTGNAIATPEIAITQNGETNLVSGNSVANFGSLLLGTEGGPQSFTIRNTGSADLDGLSIHVSGASPADFVVSSLESATLAPGANATFTVFFKPTAGGTRTATLQVISNDADENPFKISLSGNGTTRPEIAVEQSDGTGLTSGTSTFDFGSSNTGTTGAAKTFTIKNLGSANLTGLVITADGAEFIVDGMAINQLAPGTSTSFQVLFKPTVAGTRTAILHIASNDADENPFNIALSGTALAVPEITVARADGSELTDSASTLDIGKTGIGSTISHSVTIRNTGTANLTGIAITLDGTQSANFSIGLPAVTTLAPGTSTTFPITFRPDTVGPASAVLHIASNDADESPFDFKLEGTGGPVPEIAIEQSDGAGLSSGSGLMLFGNVNIGASSAPQTFTIRNLGTAELTNLAITTDGANSTDFAVSGLTATALAPGASTSIQIVFKPTAAGTRNANVHVTSNDVDESPYHIALTGTAVAVPEITLFRAENVELTDSASVVSFGTVNLGTTGASQTITIKNPGSAALTGLAIVTTGDHPSDFVISAPSVSTLAPGASTTFTIAFHPGADGSRSAVLHLASNDADENPFDFELEGMGAAVPLPAILTSGDTWVTTGTVSQNLGGILLGTTGTPVTITLKNLGTAVLSGLNIVPDGVNASDFTVDSLAENSLAPGASTTFHVTLKPSAAGTRSAAIHFTSNEIANFPFDIALSGNAIIVPEIAVSLASGGDLTSGNGTSAFGETTVGVSGESKSFTIKNLGTANLTNLTIFITGADFSASPLAKTTLAPGASTTFNVSFTPSAAGSRSAVLRIASNDADENPFILNLAGSGMALPTIAIKSENGANLIDGSAVIDFGTFTLGNKSKKMTFTVSNLTAAQLTGMTLVANGLNAADFSITSLKSKSLPPQSNTSFTVTFKPSSIGTRLAAVHISSGIPGDPAFDIVLTGTGVAKPSKSSKSSKSSTITSAITQTASISTIQSVTVVNGQKYATLTLTWPKGQRDTSRVVEVSSDLLDWFSGSNYTTVLVSTDTTLTVRDNTPVTEDSKRFIRLKPN